MTTALNAPETISPIFVPIPLNRSPILANMPAIKLGMLIKKFLTASMPLRNPLTNELTASSTLCEKSARAEPMLWNMPSNHFQRPSAMLASHGASRSPMAAKSATTACTMAASNAPRMVGICGTNATTRSTRPSTMSGMRAGSESAIATKTCTVASMSGGMISLSSFGSFAAIFLTRFGRALAIPVIARSTAGRALPNRPRFLSVPSPNSDVTRLSTDLPMSADGLAKSPMRFCHAALVELSEPSMVVPASLAVVPVMPISCWTMWIASVMSAYELMSNFLPDSFSASASKRSISLFVPP